uniref:Uncharacterized protein n=1 Tax=Romanomermis culicivorax TaxID=13658 RepID=A0A915L311_ROMCU
MNGTKNGFIENSLDEFTWNEQFGPTLDLTYGNLLKQINKKTCSCEFWGLKTSRKFKTSGSEGRKAGTNELKNYGQLEKIAAL